MTQKGLVIYDNNGTVVAILMGIETVPAGVQSVVVEITGEIKSAQVNPETKEVTIEYYPEDPEVADE